MFGGWGEVSAAKGAAIQASGPAFDPWDGQPLGFSMKQKKRWDPEMAQLVKALTIISKDQSSIPGTRGRRELTSDLHKHTMVLCPCVCAHTVRAQEDQSFSSPGVTGSGIYPAQVLGTELRSSKSVVSSWPLHLPLTPSLT